MHPRPLHEIAREIAATWETPSPHAKAYLKAMHYLIGIDDSFVAGTARRIVRCFLLYAKEWQGADAERIKAELVALGQHSVAELARVPCSSTGILANSATLSDAPDACELCKLPIADKFVHGHSVWGIEARMCPACHFNIGVGFARGDGALYHRQPDGTWRHLHGTCPSAVLAQPPSPFSGKIPLVARAKRGTLTKMLAPTVRRLVKTAWSWSAWLRGRGKRDAA